MANRFTERERKGKAVAPQFPPNQSSSSTGTNASHPLVANPRRYDPSGYLIRRTISSSLLIGDSSTEVHQHHDEPRSTINPRGKEKELHTFSLSNTNIPTPVQPNIVFGYFPAQPNQRFMVGAASTTTSSLPPHPGHGILGRTPPHPGHGILGCKPIGYQHASLGEVNNRPAMYNIPNSRNGYQHASLGEVNKQPSHNNIPNSQDGYQHASLEEVNMRPSHNVSNCHMGKVVNNQAKAKSSTSTSVEFLPGRFPTAPQIQSQRERDYQRENLVAVSQQQQGWTKLYTLFPPSPPPPPPPQDFGGKGKFRSDDPDNPYYPLPAHFINMDDFS